MTDRTRAIFLSVTFGILTSGIAIASSGPLSKKPLNDAEAEIVAKPAARMLHSQSTVYVYSFLNAVENSLTPDVIAKIHGQLETAFTSKGINHKLWSFQPASVVGTVSSAANYGGSFAPISIPNTIKDNKDEERKVGAQFRLLIIPSRFSMSLYSRYYEIKFLLIDIENEQVAWGYKYSGSHLVMLKESENSEARAKKIISSALDNMRDSGIIG